MITKKQINESSGGDGSDGAYSGLIVLSPQIWKETQIVPFFFILIFIINCIL